MKRIKITGLFILITILLLNNCSLHQNRSSGPIRILKLMIVADQKYRNEINNWKKEVAYITNIASKALNSQKVGIKLKITGFADWQKDTEENTDIKNMVNELKNDFPRKRNSNFDLVVGFTSHKLKNAIGAANMDGYLLISNTWNFRIKILPSEQPLLFVQILLHEIGHIFGCEDIDNEKSVMNRNVSLLRTAVISFDKKNLKIMRTNRWRMFSLRTIGRVKIEKNKTFLY